jgi:hypothetical protein
MEAKLYYTRMSSGALDDLVRKYSLVRGRDSLDDFVRKYSLVRGRDGLDDFVK